MQRLYFIKKQFIPIRSIYVVINILSLNIEWLDRATGALAFDPVSLKLPHVEEAFLINTFHVV